VTHQDDPIWKHRGVRGGEQLGIVVSDRKLLFVLVDPSQGEGQAIAGVRREVFLKHPSLLLSEERLDHPIADLNSHGRTLNWGGTLGSRLKPPCRVCDTNDAWGLVAKPNTEERIKGRKRRSLRRNHLTSATGGVIPVYEVITIIIPTVGAVLTLWNTTRIS
jgi:hypothetical protein